jgi:hypothetical protein
MCLNGIIGLLTAVTLLVAIPSVAGDKNVLFRDDFETLDNWRPFYLPKIKQHSTYVIHAEGDTTVLKAESVASASALVYKDTFSVYDYPCAQWRWKVENVYRGGDARIKQGDDYPMRVYVVFPYDPTEAGFFEKVKNTAAKLVYGEYPPHSTLTYLWANKRHEEAILTSAYTRKSRLIPLQAGSQHIGAWHVESVNIIEDYVKAFGVKPPEKAGIAIMNDSDNTGEQSVSYLDYIEVYREMENNDS